MLLFALDPPPGIVPPMPAPQGDRASSLLSWTSGPGGCGLNQLVAALQKIIDFPD